MSCSLHRLLKGAAHSLYSDVKLLGAGLSSGHILEMRTCRLSVLLPNVPSFVHLEPQTLAVCSWSEKVVEKPSCFRGLPIHNVWRV